MLILSTMMNGIVNIQQFNMTVVLGERISGLASTGLYKLFRNLIQKKRIKKIEP